MPDTPLTVEDLQSLQSDPSERRFTGRADYEQTLREVLTAVRRLTPKLQEWEEWKPELTNTLDQCMEYGRRFGSVSVSPLGVPIDAVRFPEELLETPQRMVRYAALKTPDKSTEGGRLLARWQEQATANTIVRTMAKALDAKYQDEGRAHYRSYLKSPLFKHYMKLTEQMIGGARAIDTETSGGASEWVPDTQLATEVIDKIRERSLLAPRFPNITMNNKSIRLPGFGSDSDVYVFPEQTGDLSDPANFVKAPHTIIGSRGTTLNARKLGARHYWTTEAIEDMTPDIGSLVVANLVRRAGDGLDDIILRGDDTATHMDSDVTGVDRRKLLDGIVRRSLTAGVGLDMSSQAAFGWADLAAAMTAMGPDFGLDPAVQDGDFGTGPLYVLPWNLMLAVMVEADSPLLTLDKVGMLATLVRGALATFMNVPIFPTRKMREDLNASGVHDGVTETETGFLAINTDRWVVGVRRGIAVRVSADRYIEEDTVVAVITWRGDFSPVDVLGDDPSAGETYSSYYGYNVDLQ